MDAMDIIKLLTGGVGGGLITLWYNRNRNKIQTIEYDLEIKSVFKSKEIGSANETSLTISSPSGLENEIFKFSNLFLVDLKFYNKSIKDFNKFSFGVSLKNNNRIVNISKITSDRHHEISINPNIEFNNPSEIVDVDFHPFNRKDTYQISLFITTANGVLVSDSVEVSSKEAILLVKNEKNSQQVEKIKALASKIIGFIYGCLLTILLCSIFFIKHTQKDISDVNKLYKTQFDYFKQIDSLDKNLRHEIDSTNAILKKNN